MSRQVHWWYSYQRLRDYALWYYFRYYPSDAKLMQKLQEKGKREDAGKVFWEIQHMLQEDEIIASKIESYIFRNKNYRYIRQKMREKLFPLEAVNTYLEKYETHWESILSHDFLTRKIQTLYARGKSTRHVFQTLWETREDREKIEQILKADFTNAEQQALRISYEKIENKYSREKIIQKLIAQWFQYSDIKNLF